MGHIHLLVLPSSKKWRQVAALLDADATTDEILSASAIAAERDFARAADEATLVEAVRLLAMLPQAAVSDDFVTGLNDLGLNIPAEPLLFDLTAAVARSLERAGDTDRSDFSVLTQRALLASITDCVGDRLPGLFDADSTDLKNAMASFAGPRQFAMLARDFFSRLVAGSLSYYLDRALSAHIGPGRRFANTAERSTFDANLDQYCREASRIIREFAAGWYGKTLYTDGAISHERAAAFAFVAFKKMREELQRKRDADA